MNVEIGAEAALFPEKQYILGIFVTVWFTIHHWGCCQCRIWEFDPALFVPEFLLWRMVNYSSLRVLPVYNLTPFSPSWVLLWRMVNYLSLRVLPVYNLTLLCPCLSFYFEGWLTIHHWGCFQCTIWPRSVRSWVFTLKDSSPHQSPPVGTPMYS